MEARKFGAHKDNIAIFDAFHNWLTEKTNRRVTILRRFEFRRDRANLIEKGSNNLLRRSGSTGGEQSAVEEVEPVKEGEKLKAAAVVKITFVRGGHGLAIAERPVLGRQIRVVARIDEIERWFES
jgi:hypothetical protein